MIKEHTLYTEKFRPTNPEDYIGNEDFKEDLNKWIANQDIPHLLLHGGAGGGKTTAAKLITSNIDCDFIYINCSDENGIETIRDKVKQFASSATFRTLKIIVMDESDFISVNAQAALRNIIETFSKTTRFIFTCNYIERIIDPLQSRTSIYEISPPSKGEVAKRCVNILNEEGVEFNNGDLVQIINKTYPDIRKSLNLLQSCVKNQKLELNKNFKNQNQYTDKMIELISSKSPTAFNSIRQLIADANIKEYNELYRALYNNLDSFHNPVLGTIIIAESQYQSVMSIDLEITFMACIANLLKTT